MKASNLLLAGLLATAATFGLTSCSQDEPAVNSTSNYGVVTRDAAKINSNIKVFAYCDGRNPEQGTPQQKDVFQAFNSRVQNYSTDGVGASVALITDRSINFKHDIVKAIYDNGGKIVWTLPSKQVFEDYVKAQGWLSNVNVDWQGAEACTAIIIYKNNGSATAVKYDNVKNPMSLDQCVDLVVAKLNGVSHFASRANGVQFGAPVFSWGVGLNGKMPAQGTYVFDVLDGRKTQWDADNAKIGIFTDESINVTEYCGKAWDIIKNKKGSIVWANPTKQNFEDFVRNQNWLNGVMSQINWRGAEACTAITICAAADGTLTATIFDNVLDNKPFETTINEVVNTVNANIRQ